MYEGGGAVCTCVSTTLYNYTYNAQIPSTHTHIILWGPELGMEGGWWLRQPTASSGLYKTLKDCMSGSSTPRCVPAAFRVPDSLMNS